MTDLTCLSYWFPKLEAAGLPVPSTVILDMPAGAQMTIWSAFDGEDGGDRASFDAFIDQLSKACETVRYPAFLRTGLTSNKHNWKNTCFVSAPEDIRQHVFNLAEFSECADLMGLPWQKWVVREFLPTIPMGVCTRYGDMPLCREFRFFVDDGSVRCFHPYWPLDSIVRGGADPSLFSALCEVEASLETELRRLASAAGAAVGGSWSIDLLETKRGWFITDMAEAHQSFHWSDCLAVAPKQDEDAA